MKQLIVNHEIANLMLKLKITGASSQLRSRYARILEHILYLAFNNKLFIIYVTHLRV